MTASAIPTPPVHGTSVARRIGGGWQGVLLTGPSGSGKSDLALRLIARGWRLVADDYSLVWRSGDAVYAAAPATIAGRIEARGVGIVGAPTVTLSRIALVVACGQSAVERLPEPETEMVAGATLPRLTLDIRPASAVESVLARLNSGPPAP